MRLSELAREARISTATIKYYLREGLLQPGRQAWATQAEYDESHVARLRMVRALVDVGGLSLNSVRSVLAAINDGPDRLWVAIDRTHDAIANVSDEPADPPRRALEALETLDWEADPDSAVVRQLDIALSAIEQVGLPSSHQQLRAYANAALAVAEQDVADIPAGQDPQDITAAVTYVVLGTVLYEPLLLALRRIAQEQVYKRVYDATTVSHHDEDTIAGDRPAGM